MRFAFTEDQLAFAEAVRDLLADNCTPDDVRRAADGNGRVTGLWDRFTEMGVLGLAVPEEFGGVGYGDVELIGVLYEAGRADVPDPLAAVAAVAAPLLVAVGGDVAAEWVPRLCSGDAELATALAWNTTVSHLDGADALLVERDGDLVLVDAGSVAATATASVDPTRRLWRVTDIGDGLSLGSGALRLARDRSTLATAAELCGGAEAMMELAVGYATERRQFGVPIGSFQAVKHLLADALIALEFAKPLVWRAAWSMATGDPDVSTHVSMAKASASEAAASVAAATLQVHGAIGYTVEYDLHLWLKRSWALQARDGDAAHHLRSVSAAVLAPPTPQS